MEYKQYIEKRDFKVLGLVGVCATTRHEFVEKVFSLPNKPTSATIMLVGIPAVISAKENQHIAQIYNTATIAAIDGMPIVNIGRKKGFNCERCAAPDIMGLIFKESITHKKTHFFYGGKNEEVLEKLRTNLEKNYPGINIVGMYSPPFRPLTAEEDNQICEKINKLHPDFLWVGIGAPKQEIWMKEHQSKIKEVTMLGVGAGFDFYAETLKKAPRWMEEASLEWLYRLFKEPKRLWKRYILGALKYAYYSFTLLIKNIALGK